MLRALLIGLAVACSVTGLQAQDLARAQEYFRRGLAAQTGDKGEVADPEIALRYYLQALKLHPPFFEAHVNAGKVYYGREEYRRAKYHFSEAIKLARSREDIGSADEAAISSDLGVCYHVEGNFPEAEKWFRGAIGLNPTLVEAHYNLINLLLATDRRQEAERQMQISRAQAPSPRYGLFEGRLRSSDSHDEWNPTWLKVAGAAVLGGALLSYLVRKARGSSRRRS